MALYRIRYVSQMLSGAADDRCVWSWGVDAASVPNPDALNPAFNTAMITGPGVTTRLHGRITNRVVPQAWEVVPAAGGPVAAYAPITTPPVFGAGAQASQVTIAITSQIQTVRLNASVGRLLMGPLHSGVGSIGRPTANDIASCLNFAAAWHNALVGLGYAPVVLRNNGTVGTPIVGYSVGNAFGVLRSRRWEVTARTSVSV